MWIYLLPNNVFLHFCLSLTNLKPDAKFYAERQANNNNSIFSVTMIYIWNLTDYVIYFKQTLSLSSCLLIIIILKYIYELIYYIKELTPQKKFPRWFKYFYFIFGPYLKLLIITTLIYFHIIVCKFLHRLICKMKWLHFSINVNENLKMKKSKSFFVIWNLQKGIIIRMLNLNFWKKAKIKQISNKKWYPVESNEHTFVTIN